MAPHLTPFVLNQGLLKSMPQKLGTPLTHVSAKSNVSQAVKPLANLAAMKAEVPVTPQTPLEMSTTPPGVPASSSELDLRNSVVTPEVRTPKKTKSILEKYRAYKAAETKAVTPAPEINSQNGLMPVPAIPKQAGPTLIGKTSSLGSGSVKAKPVAFAFDILTGQQEGALEPPKPHVIPPEYAENEDAKEIVKLLDALEMSLTNPDVCKDVLRNLYMKIRENQSLFGVIANDESFDLCARAASVAMNKARIEKTDRKVRRSQKAEATDELKEMFADAGIGATALTVGNFDQVVSVLGDADIGGF